MPAPSQPDLSTALSDAASAHHEYETTALKGERDAQWSGFYAAFAIGRLGDFAKPSALAGWLEEASGDNWSDAAAKLVLARLDG